MTHQDFDEICADLRGPVFQMQHLLLAKHDVSKSHLDGWTLRINTALKRLRAHQDAARDADEPHLQTSAACEDAMARARASTNANNIRAINERLVTLESVCRQVCAILQRTLPSPEVVTPPLVNVED